MTDPITPETIQHLAVTVSEPDEMGLCRVVYPEGIINYWRADRVRANDLTVPEPTVECAIGDIEFDVPRALLDAIPGWWADDVGTQPLDQLKALIGDAARRWVDGREQR